MQHQVGRDLRAWAHRRTFYTWHPTMPAAAGMANAGHVHPCHSRHVVLDGCPCAAGSRRGSRGGVRMHIGEVRRRDEYGVGCNSQVGRHIRRRLAVAQDAQLQLRVSPALQAQCVEADAIPPVGTLQPRRLRHRLRPGQLAAEVEIETHHLLAQARRHGVGVNMPQATVREGHRHPEAPASVRLVAMAVQEGPEVAADCDQVQLLAQFGLVACDRPAGAEPLSRQRPCRVALGCNCLD